MGVLLSGSTSRSLAQGSARTEDGPIGQALTAQFHRRTPQGISSVPSVAGATVPPVFPRLPFITFHAAEKGNIYRSPQKPSLVSYSISIVSLLNWSFFFPARFDQRKNRRKNVSPARDDLSIDALSTAVFTIIQDSKLARRGTSKVSVIVRKQFVRNPDFLSTGGANEIFSCDKIRQ